MPSFKVTFVYSVLTSFVKKDIEILKNMNVSLSQIKSAPKKDFLNFFINRINEFFKSICKKIEKIFIWIRSNLI